MSYDVFGTGRTALKTSLGRYNGRTGVGTYVMAGANNPFLTSVSSVRRTWNDANGNYKPDCDLTNFASNGECGGISDQNFGKQNPRANRYADDVLHGWDARDFFWDLSTEVQQQFGDGFSMTAGYYRFWYGNFRVTDNLAVAPADYSPYCVTAPTTAGNGQFLPGGGGYQVCGMYDVSPAKYGQVSNLVTQASHFGKQSDTADFIGINVDGRFAELQFGGGLDTGRSVTDQCFSVDSPQQLLHCKVVTPFGGQTQIKFHGSYAFPAGVSVSGNIQNVSGPQILATYTARNPEIASTLGRNLASCGTQVVCNAAAGGIPLIEPGTQFSSRNTDLDMRVSKIVRLGTKSLQLNFDIYNVLNRSGVQNHINSFGSRWLRPTQLQDPRLFQLGGQLTF